LTKAVSAEHTAELVRTYAEGHLAQAWADATGKSIHRKTQDPVGTFTLSKEPKVDLLPPRQSVAALIGQELSHMQAVLALEGASFVPEEIFTKKYFRLRLANGKLAGSVSSSNELDDRRRDYLVRVRSNVRQASRRGARELRVLNIVYGTVHHYVVVSIDGPLQAFAYLQCVRPSVDHRGAFGLPEKRRDTECFSSLRRDMRYVNIEAIDAVVGTLFVRDRHVVLCMREVVSTD